MIVTGPSSFADMVLLLCPLALCHVVNSRCPVKKLLELRPALPRLDSSLTVSPVSSFSTTFPVRRYRPTKALKLCRTTVSL